MAEADKPTPSGSRVCTKCGVEKPVAEFYRNHVTGKPVTRCSACIRAAMRQYYAEHREKVRESNKRYLEREDPEQRRRRTARCREKHRREYAVRARTNRLRVLGVLELDPHCADCGGAASDLHHEAYREVVALVSLCRRCHMARHYRVWRRDGGGPVRYPAEYRKE